MMYVRNHGYAANLNWADTDTFTTLPGTEANLSWGISPTVEFVFNEYQSDLIDFVFRNDSGVISTAVNLLFSGEPFTANPINLVFGLPGNAEITDITGSAAIIVGVSISGGGELSPVANSNINIDVTTTTSGTVAISGTGITPISVSVSGTGEIVSNVVIYGNSSINIDVSQSSTGVRELFLDSNIAITVDSISTGVKEIYADGGSILVDLVIDGTGEITGGFEIFGDSSYSISVDINGTAAVLDPIFGNSSTTIPVIIAGDGTSVLVYDDIFGNSSISISVDTSVEGDLIEKDRTLLIDRLSSNKKEIVYEAEIVVDVDNEDYEIRSINSSVTFLEAVKRSKLKETFELGSEIKDEFELVEQPGTQYKTTRRTVLRKYGASEIYLRINISKDYRFIKNEVNVKRLVEREIDRAILDTYALYELEFE